jgi:hypothetical protein
MEPQKLYDKILALETLGGVSGKTENDFKANIEPNIRRLAFEEYPKFLGLLFEQIDSFETDVWEKGDFSPLRAAVGLIILLFPKKLVAWVKKNEGYSCKDRVTKFFGLGESLPQKFIPMITKNEEFLKLQQQRKKEDIFLGFAIESIVDVVEPINA